MGICDVCGNEYDKSFEVLKAGKRYVFDSIECAAQAIAPAEPALTVEHALDFFRVFGFGQRQAQKDARLVWIEVVRGDHALLRLFCTFQHPTCAFAVGARVPHIETGVGAVTSQSFVLFIESLLAINSSPGGRMNFAGSFSCRLSVLSFR